MAWTVPAVATYKWLYVNDFDLILGNTTEENRLLCYAYAQGYNRLALFGLNHLNSGAVFPSNVKTDLSNFITKAQDLYFINVGGVFGGPNVLDSIIDYNDTTGVANNTIFVSAISELEWWNYSYNLPFQTQNSSGHYSFVEAMRFLTARKTDLNNSGASLICYTGWTHPNGFAYDYTTGSDGNGLPIIAIDLALNQITVKGDFTNSGIMNGCQMQVGDTLTLNDYPNTGARTDFLVSNVTNSGGNTVLTTSNASTLTTPVIGTANVNTGYNISAISNLTTILISGNKTLRFRGVTLGNNVVATPLKECSTITIENSTNNNGTYTVTSVYWVSASNKTVLTLSTPLNSTNVSGFVNPDVVGKISDSIITYPGGAAVSELEMAYSVYDEFWLHDYVSSAPKYDYTRSRLILLGAAAATYSTTKQVGFIVSAESGFSGPFFEGAGGGPLKNVADAYDYYTKLVATAPLQSGSPLHASNENTANITSKLFLRSISIFHYGHIRALNSGNGDNFYISISPTSPINVTGPGSITLNALICDDCLPTPGNYTYTWTITGSPLGSNNGLNTVGNSSLLVTSNSCPDVPTPYSVTLLYDLPGTYTVSFSVEDPYALDQYTTAKEFTVNVAPAATPTFEITSIGQTVTALCAEDCGGLAEFIYNSTLPAGTALQWQIVDAYGSVIGSENFTVAGSGSGTVGLYPNTLARKFCKGTYIVNIYSGSTVIATSTFTITNPPPITGLFTKNPILCNGGTTTLAVTASGGTTHTLTDIISDYSFNDAAKWNLNNTYPGSNLSSIGSGKLTLTTGAAAYNEWRIGDNVISEVFPAATSFTIKYNVTTGVMGYNANLYMSDKLGVYHLIAGSAVSNTSYTGTITLSNQGTAAGITPQLRIYIAGGVSAGTVMEIVDFRLQVVTNTTGPYTYLWSPGGATTSSITGVTAGTKSVTITDSNGCSVIKSVTLTEPKALIAPYVKNDVSCTGGADGSILLNVSGGTPPYTYTWTGITPTPPNTQSNPTNLVAGTYSCVITDKNSCTLNTGSIVISGGNSLVFTMTGATDVCVDTLTTSTYSVAPGGGNAGVAPYTYLWDNGKTGDSADYTFSTQTTPSPYIVSCTITDSNGCITTVNRTVNLRTLGNFIANITEAGRPFTTCTGSNLILTVTNGVNGYWNDFSSTTSPTIILDDSWFQTNGLVATNNIISAIGDGTKIIYTTSTPITPIYNGDSTQYVTVTGLLPAEFNVTGHPTILSPTSFSLPVTGVTRSATQILGAIVSTTYYDFTWTEVDPTGVCSIESAPLRIFAPKPTTLSATITAVPCNSPSPNVGAIDLTVTGCSPFTYLWSGPSGFSATSQDITALVTGTYAVTVTDNVGDTIIKSVYIPVSSPQINNVEIINTCNGDPNGSIDFSVTGGTSPYTYSWSSPTYPNIIFPTTTLINNLGNGGYIVTITDANGCITTKRFTIRNADPIVITSSVIDATCVSVCDGSITVNATGGSVLFGTPTYTYLWTDDTQGDTLKNVCPGDHTVTVTDDNGCSNSLTINVPAPDPVKVTYTLTQANISQGTLGCINFTSITGGSSTKPSYTIYRPGYTPSTNTVFCNLTPGTYTYYICDTSNPSVITSGTSIATKGCCTPVTFTISNRCDAFSIPELKLQLYKFQCCAGKLAAKYVQYQDIGRADLAKCLLSDLKYLSLALSSLTCIDTLEDSCLSCDDISNILDQMKNICDCDCCLDAGEHTYEMIYDPATGAFTPIIPSIN